MKAVDVFLLILLALVIGLALRTMVRNRRRGKSCLGCCENCTGCRAKGESR